MTEPTITFEGVEIPDFGERQFPDGVIEAARRCDPHREAFFFFRDPNLT